MPETIRLEGKVSVVGADDHPHAMRRLRTALPQAEWVSAAETGELERSPVLVMSTDPARDEGAFGISIESGEGGPRVAVDGGPFSGVIYGVEELIQKQASVAGSGIELPTGTVEQAPGLKYRTFWNWDHSTNWDLNQIGVQEIGVMNPYAKPADGFLADFRRVVDFMSMNRIAAIAIYGFFRESHGGVEAAQELCRYANERGVRILPGVAINAYGGAVWEMDHPYNLTSWLRQHPELSAQMERPPGFQLQDLAFDLYFPDAVYAMRGCPSRPENQQWMEDGIAWLAETCDIGGINIEAGDYGVCGCPLCESRRAAREDARRREGYAESWSHADMADFYPRLYDAALSKRSDLWIYSEIQWDNLLDAEAMAPLRSLPQGGIYQHTFNRSYWNRAKQELTPGYAAGLPTKTNVFRCQFCCQWNGDNRTERYFFNGRDFHDMAKKAHQTGFDGLTVWGEPSPYHTSTELSYNAFARFTWDPSLSWDDWLREDAGPLLGGEEAARRYIDLSITLDQHANLDRAELDRITGEALDAVRSSSGDVARRWLWLADQATRRRFMTI
ncbi:MAG: hypothetical protein KF883_08555 [Thermomicrobiales bacterium]|nr:hypothetical protein [Thermomicrobiales bacterium]